MSNIGPITTSTDQNDPQQQQQQQQQLKLKGNDDNVVVDWNQFGVPTTLLRRVQIITEGPDRLPVYTATFALPPDIPTNTTTTPNESNDNNNTNTQTNTHNQKLKIKSHSQIRIDLGDVIKMIIPNYKPKSYSISSIRLNEKEFDITYKLYPNGRASSYIHSLIPTMDISKQIYTFVKQSNRYHNPGTHIGIIVYGVGITEGLPIARAELERTNSTNSSTVQKVILIWCARTIHDTFWYNHIQQLLVLYPTQFHMIYILSRQQQQQQQQQHEPLIIQPTLPTTSISQTEGQQIQQQPLKANSNDQEEIDTTTTSTSTSSTPSNDASPIVSSNTNTNTEQYIYGQRLNETLLHSIFVEPYENFYKDTTRFVIAGTKDMISSTEQMLYNIGYMDMKIKHSLLPKTKINK